MRCLAFILSVLVWAQASGDGSNDPDRVRLAEAWAISTSVGEAIWPGWDAAPSAVLLVDEDREYLLWHPNPSEDFVAEGHDELLETDVWSRPRQFDTGLLATFPAVNGLVSVVIGTPEATGRKSTRWLITVLHEHFHQMQMSQTDYYDRVAGLELTGGDQSGMWMLNYPFPYGQTELSLRYSEIGEALADVLENGADAEFSRDRVATLFAQIKTAVSDADYRYLMFQLWQEGIARYVQHRALSLIDDGSISKEFAGLDDYDPPSLVRTEQNAALLAELRGLDLAQQQRTAFYPVGAAWALLLDRLEPAWREEYFAQPFVLPGLPLPD